MGRAERVSAILLLGGGIAVTAYSYRDLKLGMLISPGAGFLPFLCGISLCILSVLWLIRNLLPGSAGEPDETHEEGPAADLAHEKGAALWGISLKMVLGIAVLIVYAWLFEKIGYFASTALFMFGWQLLLERESIFKSLAVTALSAGIMYTLFHQLLGVQLPAGSWLP